MVEVRNDAVDAGKIAPLKVDLLVRFVSRNQDLRNVGAFISISSSCGTRRICLTRTGTFARRTCERWTRLPHLAIKAEAPTFFAVSDGAHKRCAMKDSERPELPPCSCVECPNHQAKPCGKEAIVKAPDGTLFCAECLMARKTHPKQQSN